MVVLYKDGKIPVKVGSEMVSSYMESGYTKEPVEEKVSKEAPKKEVEVPKKEVEQVVEEIAKSVSEEPQPSENKEEEVVKTPYKKRSYSKRS